MPLQFAFTGCFFLPEIPNAIGRRSRKHFFERIYIPIEKSKSPIQSQFSTFLFFHVFSCENGRSLIAIQGFTFFPDPRLNFHKLQLRFAFFLFFVLFGSVHQFVFWAGSSVRYFREVRQQFLLLRLDQNLALENIPVFVWPFVCSKTQKFF